MYDRIFIYLANPLLLVLFSQGSLIMRCQRGGIRASDGSPASLFPLLAISTIWATRTHRASSVPVCDHPSPAISRNYITPQSLRVEHRLNLALQPGGRCLPGTPRKWLSLRASNAEASAALALPATGWRLPAGSSNLLTLRTVRPVDSVALAVLPGGCHSPIALCNLLIPGRDKVKSSATVRTLNEPNVKVDGQTQCLYPRGRA
jgi:hypothetical protein